MKIADLYIRVSTDEQADKGYSQRNQEEQLRKYCVINSLTIGKVIYEDHSAKTFNRPEWKKLLLSIRKQKGAMTDLILFTKWDRFSRNTADSYQMIGILRSFGIEPQAIEQPLDLSIPENKMMLAFYLAVPEVENDRRSLNTFFGMRRAKKEGRWMATAPVGYKNRVKENGQKYIAPSEPSASIMKWAFESLAEGSQTMSDILRECRKKGLRCSKNNFWVAMRNPVYCGKIFIPKYKDEEACFVQGQHEAIISLAIFDEAQNVMNGRKKKSPFKISSPSELPLRGFLICPRCGKNLSGSPSKGKTKWHFYYHCRSACGYRVSAPLHNENFKKYLKRFEPLPPAMECYLHVIEAKYNTTHGNSGILKRELLKEMKDMETKMAKIRQLLMDGDIDPLDYKELKGDYDQKISSLEEKLRDVANRPKSVSTLIKLLMNTLIDFEKLYSGGDIEVQRNIISTIYPFKLIFENEACRTPRVNEGVDAIFQINKVLAENKNGTELDFSSLSHQVIPLGFEPRTTTLKV